MSVITSTNNICTNSICTNNANDQWAAKERGRSKEEAVWVFKTTSSLQRFVSETLLWHLGCLEPGFNLSSLIHIRHYV